MNGRWPCAVTDRASWTLAAKKRRGEVSVTEGTPGGIVRVAAYAKRQSMVAANQWVHNLELGTGRPVGADNGTQVLWPFTFEVDENNAR